MNPSRRDSAIRRAVLRWAPTCDRPLPWRGERNPYRVLVSEVMLQQTQAPRVVPSYESFLNRFPTVASLAGARAADVLREWGTLGYNRRALHLHEAARTIARQGWPADLRELPGVGPYTSRALASFAFGADEAVVEANVRRIIERMEPGTADVQARADELLPRGRAAAWNQALMDLGATVCKPRSPDCGSCPLRMCCASAGAVPRSRTTGQPRFEHTSRYARGRVVAALRTKAMSIDELTAATGLERARLADAIGTLTRDGLISGGRRLRLGQRARARRASTSDTR